jgi:hypothetical protein
MKVATSDYSNERKSNTYYTNTKKRDQQPDFKDTLLAAIQNISKNHRMMNR